MPKITYVKAAQQRYEMVPVLGEDGQPVRTEVAGRTTKSGRSVSRRQSRPDLDKPLPPYTCDHCREPIAIGTPYKHISPKSDALEQWADEIENTSVPDFPEPEEADCEACDGAGKENPDPDDSEQEREARDDCGECSGTGSVTPDEATEEQVDEWRDEVRNEFSVVSEPPV